MVAHLEPVPPAARQLSTFRQRELAAFVVGMIAVLAFGAMAARTVPSGSSIAFLVLVLTCVVALLRPRLALPSQRPSEASPVT